MSTSLSLEPRDHPVQAADETLPAVARPFNQIPERRNPMSPKVNVAVAAVLLVATASSVGAFAQSHGSDYTMPTGHPLSTVYDATKAQFGSQRQRTLNPNNFIIQQLNLDGYAREMGIEPRRFSDQ